MRSTSTPTIDGWQRCFIALAPDTTTRDALATIPVSPNARRVIYEQLHLTVTFIGSLSAEQGGALSSALAQHNLQLTPTQITAIEHWPNATHPRLTVATLALTDEFIKLDWWIRSLMIDQGLPVDARAFRPHITLARFAREAGAIDGTTHWHPPTNLNARFDSLILYSSTLARHGARYQALSSNALG